MLHISDEIDEDILQILQSLVAIEGAALDDFDCMCDGKVFFCSFDLSFLPTVIDPKPDLRIVQKAVEVISQCLERIRVFIMKGSKDPFSSRYLTSMIEKLLLLYDMKGEIDFKLLSSTMPTSAKWPIERLSKGAMYYGSELQVISSRLHNFDAEATEHYLQLEHFLGELIGRLIRYYLRFFFNAKPPVLTTPSDTHPAPDFTSTRSRIHSLIHLHCENTKGTKDTAINDGSISSYVSLSLSRVWDLHINVLEEEMNVIQLQPLSGTTMNGRLPPSESDLQDITIDIDYLRKIVLGTNSCRFLLELFTFPGVDHAIEDVGGWCQVERYANLFYLYDLERIQPDIAHFILLRNVSHLIHHLTKKRKLLQDLEHECRERLKFISTKFRCSVRNKRLGNKTIAVMLHELIEASELPLIAANF